jgi:nicotinamidase-related amidase
MGITDNCSFLDYFLQWNFGYKELLIFTMRISLLFLIVVLINISGCQSGHYNTLTARSYIKDNQNNWMENTEILHWKPEETAIIICDMWDRHWCINASKRVAEMVPQMNRVLKNARKDGITIIHAPSGTMDFYKDYPQRIKMVNASFDKSSHKIKDWYYLDPEKEAELPVDDSDGGCDSNPEPENVHVWTRQIESLEIFDEDGISDSGKEINNYFIERGIKNVILMGVHINMCVLGRPFGIRSQVNRCRNVVVVRDLTDSMYNPGMPPYVSHDEGTRLVIQHIEKYWCPSIESSDLL